MSQSYLAECCSGRVNQDKNMQELLCPDRTNSVYNKCWSSTMLEMSLAVSDNRISRNHSYLDMFSVWSHQLSSEIISCAPALCGWLYDGLTDIMYSINPTNYTKNNQTLLLKFTTHCQQLDSHTVTVWHILSRVVNVPMQMLSLSHLANRLTHLERYYGCFVCSHVQDGQKWSRAII